MREESWVIEKRSSETSTPLYFTCIKGDLWSDHNLMAFRLARKIDAETLANYFFGSNHGHRICQHIWE